MEKIDFKNLSDEQERLLQEILKVCKYFQVTRSWNPSVSDGVLAEQARELGWKFSQLERLSK